jgi:hypothetical protein
VTTMPSLKLYGERNTGTNYLSRLLDLNLEARLLRGVAPPCLRRLFPRSELARDLYFTLTFGRNLGWKHSVAPSVREIEATGLHSPRLFFVTLTKNPYAWLLSLYRNPYHYRGQAASFEDFLAAPWRPVRRARATAVYENPVVMWNEKNASYIRLAAGLSTINLRYVDLLSDPERAVARIASAWGIDWKASRFRNLEQSTKERNEKSFSYYQDYYLQRRWREELSSGRLDLVNRYLDPHLMETFGYRFCYGKSTG